MKNCLLHVPSLALGADGISVGILRACWKAIKRSVAVLNQLFLAFSYYPNAFRRADLVLLPKPIKKDLGSVRSWRPTVVLPCLGKGLERLIARCPSRTAIHQKVPEPQQFGTLPKRSSLDLVSCII